MIQKVKLHFSIADINLSLTISSKAAEGLLSEWKGFLVKSPLKSSYCIRVESLPLKVNDEVNQNYTPAKPTILEFSDELLHITQTDLFNLKLNLTTQIGTLKYHPWVKQTNNGPAGVRVALTSFWSSMLIKNGGLLLHASGIKLLDKGVAFVGPSGAGKSTVCSMFPAKSILNDELIAITNIASTPMIHSTPFMGKQKNFWLPQKAPLRLGLQLKKSSQLKLLNLPQKEAFKLITNCVAIPKGCQNIERIAFEQASNLLTKISWHQLEFSLDSIKIEDYFKKIL